MSTSEHSANRIRFHQNRCVERVCKVDSFAIATHLHHLRSAVQTKIGVPRMRRSPDDWICRASATNCITSVGTPVARLCVPMLRIHMWSGDISLCRDYGLLAFTLSIRNRIRETSRSLKLSNRRMSLGALGIPDHIRSTAVRKVFTSAPWAHPMGLGQVEFSLSITMTSTCWAAGKSIVDLKNWPTISGGIWVTTP